MNLQNVAVGIVGILVAILVIATVAVPVIDDSVKGTTYTGTNTGADSTYTYTESPTFAFSSAAGSTAVTYTINGNAATDGGRKEIITDAFGFRWTTAGEMTLWNFAANTYLGSLGTADAVTITCTAGAYSITINDNAAVTGTCTMALLPDSEGKWGYFGSAMKATVDAEVITGHLTNVTSLGPINFAKVKNGEVTGFIVDPVKVGTGSTLVAASEVTYDFDYQTLGENQAVGYYAGVSYTWDDNTKTSLRMYAPLDFESTATDAGGINSTLLLLIPVLLFVVAVMLAVRMIKDA